jgi:hypothetical protein
MCTTRRKGGKRKGTNEGRKGWWGRGGCECAFLFSSRRSTKERFHAEDKYQNLRRPVSRYVPISTTDLAPRITNSNYDDDDVNDSTRRPMERQVWTPPSNKYMHR